MASPDLNELFQAAVTFAETMLAKEGEFIPFGVLMDTYGKVALVAGDVGSERPISADVIALLQSSFMESAAKGAIRAAGICLDIRTVPPGQDTKSDAICVRLAHVSSEAVEVFVPYAEHQPGIYVYGERFAAQAQDFKFNKS